jgi:hypothetical protein
MAFASRGWLEQLLRLMSKAHLLEMKKTAGSVGSSP